MVQGVIVQLDITACNPPPRQQPMEVDALLDKQVRMISCGAEHMACTVVHGWVPDEEAKSCMACKKTFTTIRRRVCAERVTIRWRVFG